MMIFNVSYVAFKELFKAFCGLFICVIIYLILIMLLKLFLHFLLKQGQLLVLEKLCLVLKILRQRLGNPEFCYIIMLWL